MPKKYIDADALIAECEEEIVDYDEDLQKHFMTKAVPTEYIEDFPAADVEEVKHGKWIDKGHFTMMCDKCEAYVAKGLLLVDQIYYCPRCGAKMDGKEQRNGQD